ncbi:MAG: DMT family transporter [Bacteroidetes bacterium]|nr:DMT family transporter [Bacteroidota bacterium]
MKYLFYILPILCGFTITTQASVNSQLRASIQNPFAAAFISFAVGTIVLFFALLIVRQGFPNVSELKTLPWHQYMGGVLGAFFVSAIIYTLPQIGSANMFVLIIAGQLITSLAYDHFGAMGAVQQNITWQKIVGVVLVIAGVYIANKK